MEIRSRFHKSISIFADESGSLILLILTLFLLLLISCLAVVDASDAFLVKRELIEIGEVGITSAAHEISLSRYYSGDILMDTSGVDGSKFRIPLDCSAAYFAFEQEVGSATLRGSNVATIAWSCVDDQVSATLEVVVPELIQLPLGIGSKDIVVDSTVAATSIIDGDRG